MQDANEQQEALLKNNPYLFTPAQYKLATLNSKIKFELKQAPSEYLQPFLNYLTGENGWDNWQVVGVQGITDFSARINEYSGDKKSYSQLLINALPHLPDEVLFPLCGALENEALTVELIDTLLILLQKSLLKNNFPEKSEVLTKTNDEEKKQKTHHALIQIQQHLLRSLASSCQHKHVEQFIISLLAQKNIAPELLITLSGRCWTALSNPKQLIPYFEHLISCEDPALFKSIFKDLVAIPVLRPIVFECMRSPDRSDSLSQAIGQLFN
jgi:hypothetical protein